MKKLNMLILVVTVILNLTIGCRQSSTNGQSASGAIVPDGPLMPFGESVTLEIPITIEPNYIFPEGQSTTENMYTKFIKDKLNVNIVAKWEVATTNANAKMNLAIASNDLPDAMVLDGQTFQKVMKTEQIQPLDDLIWKYSLPAVADNLRRRGQLLTKIISNKDGKLMALPHTIVDGDNYRLMWIRQDWLDNLNLSAPRSTEELRKIAAAFVQKDPDGNGQNDTVGIGTTNTTGLAQMFAPVFAAFGSFPQFWLKTAENRLVYGSTLPETKTALEYLALLYAEGLIDKELGIRKNPTELIASGTAGIFFNPWWTGYWPLPNAFLNNPEANWQAYALPLDGAGKWTVLGDLPSTTYMVVRKDYPYPEAAIGVPNANFAFNTQEDSSKVTLSVNLQPLYLPFANVNELDFSVQKLRECLASSEAECATQKQEAPRSYPLLHNDLNILKSVKLKPYDNTSIQYWNRETAPTFFNRLYSLLVGAGAIVNAKTKGTFVELPKSVYTSTETMAKRSANLAKLEEETFLKIITGAENVSAFDEFVSKWQKEGGEGITVEVNARFGD